MAETTETTENTDKVVLDIHIKFADILTNSVHWDYTVYVCEDGGGPYLSLSNPADDEDYRCLSLAEPSCSDNLDLYRWRFWNNTANVWLDSELGADADIDTVLAYLTECLAEERRELAALDS